MMISPAYAYEKAPDSRALPSGRTDPPAVQRGVRRQAEEEVGASTTPRCSSTSSRARWTSSARLGAFPATRSSAGSDPATSWPTATRPATGELVETTRLGCLRTRQGSAVRELHGSLRLRASGRHREPGLAPPVASRRSWIRTDRHERHHRPSRVRACHRRLTGMPPRDELTRAPLARG